MDSCDIIYRGLGLSQWKDRVVDIIQQPNHKPNLIAYTHHGDVIVNQGIRQGKLSLYAIKLYNNLSQIISRVPGLPTDILVYRGVKNYNNISSVIPGDVIQEYGFISTTLDLSVAMSFTDPEERILMNLIVPKNVHCVILHGKFDTSRFDECELLIPMNPVLRITSNILTVVNEMKTRVILAEVIDFNTPKADELTAMANFEDDKIYDKLLQLKNDQPNFIVYNDRLFGTRSKDFDYDLIFRRTDNIAYVVNNINSEILNELIKPHMKFKIEGDYTSGKSFYKEGDHFKLVRNKWNNKWTKNLFEYIIEKKQLTSYEYPNGFTVHISYDPVNVSPDIII